MPIQDVIQLLIEERDRINRALEALGETSTPGKRRGRPRKNALHNAPEWVTGKKPRKKRKARVFTAKQRKEQGARMREYWKKKKAAAK